jgi:hypothetical protein
MDAATVTDDAAAVQQAPTATEAEEAADEAARSVRALIDARVDAVVGSGWRSPAGTVVDELYELAAIAGTAAGGPGVGVVEPATQTLWMFDGVDVSAHLISTGKGGISARHDSNGTPPGRHRIEWVVRGNTDEIVRGFGPTGRYAKGGSTAWMTTRAYGMVGIETRNASSAARGIFLHGTNMDYQLGRAASGGCIRIADADAVALDGTLRAGSLLSIMA